MTGINHSSNLFEKFQNHHMGLPPQEASFLLPLNPCINLYQQQMHPLHFYTLNHSSHQTQYQYWRVGIFLPISIWLSLGFLFQLCFFSSQPFILSNHDLCLLTLYVPHLSLLIFCSFSRFVGLCLNHIVGCDIVAVLN